MVTKACEPHLERRFKLELAGQTVYGLAFANGADTAATTMRRLQTSVTKYR
jgi:hypothetical protein